MVKLVKDGGVKTLTNETLIEMLKAQGWKEEKETSAKKASKKKAD